MLTTQRQESKLNLRLTESWSSFEKFRTEGAKALASIKNGAIASLTTKTGQYKIIEESDFQALQGLASEIDRLQGGLRTMTIAVRTFQKHPDQEHIELLTQIIANLGELPVLPTRERFNPIEPENMEGDDEDDDIILDPNNIERPLEAEKQTLEV